MGGIRIRMDEDGRLRKDNGRRGYMFCLAALPEELGYGTRPACWLQRPWRVGVLSSLLLNTYQFQMVTSRKCYLQS